MVLDPGESTKIKMRFTMHPGMEGFHDFRVHMPNNDAEWGGRTLRVLSNWVR